MFMFDLNWLWKSITRLIKFPKLFVDLNTQIDAEIKTAPAKSYNRYRLKITLQLMCMKPVRVNDATGDSLAIV